MEQYRSSLAPRTQRRSQNVCSDVAKIRSISESCKDFAYFFQFLPFLPQKFVRVDKIHYLCRC